MKIGFDNKEYLEAQTKAILDRVKKFDKKLYLEFGGKICYDYHAARVLPGYDANVKIDILRKLKDVEIIFCISAKDIEKGTIRADFGLTYESMTLKTIRDLQDFGLSVSSVIINRFADEVAAIKFKRYLENLGIKVYTQPEIQGYPADIKKIVSKEGYGRNPYIKTKRSIVVVTGAGPGSGKMSTCLSQLYHDNKKGLKSGYAKFETFPIWDLPIDHPVNVAYEASTANLGDKNMVDPFHLMNYNKVAVNYNRDIENFSVMKDIINNIVSKDNFVSSYKSPTDMCVSNTGVGIIDDRIVREASCQEIIRRYFRYKKDVLLGVEDPNAVEIMEKLMQQLDLKIDDRKVVKAARKAAEEAEKKGKGHKGIFCGAAVELPNGEIVTGKNSTLLHAESAAILNAVKKLANIPDNISLLPLNILENIGTLKKEVLDRKSESLNLEEALVALSISAASNPMAEVGVKMLKKLKDCEMHVTHLPSGGDEAGLIKLRMNVTTDAKLPFSLS